MNDHLKGLSVLYFLLSYIGVAFAIFEAPYFFVKLFAVSFGLLNTIQLLNEYNERDEN